MKLLPWRRPRYSRSTLLVDAWCPCCDHPVALRWSSSDCSGFSGPFYDIASTQHCLTCPVCLFVVRLDLVEQVPVLRPVHPRGKVPVGVVSAETTG
jgi:hypothetical protein